MMITAKTRYGLKTLMDIAYHHRSGPVQRRQIAVRQGIPMDYMDQILLRLRNSGIIQSLRGREGGYHLAKEPEQISAWDVVVAVEDVAYSVDKNNSESKDNYATSALTTPAWDDIVTAVSRQLRRTPLSHMLEDAEERISILGIDPISNLTSRDSVKNALGKPVVKESLNQVTTEVF